MTIVRDGKTYELTQTEMIKIYDEIRLEAFRRGIGYAVDDNVDNLRFTDGYTMEDFIDDCVAEVYERIDNDRKDYDDYDAIVFEVAESNNVWEG